MLAHRAPCGLDAQVSERRRQLLTVFEATCTWNHWSVEFGEEVHYCTTRGWIAAKGSVCRASAVRRRSPTLGCRRSVAEFLRSLGPHAKNARNMVKFGFDGLTSTLLPQLVVLRSDSPWRRCARLKYGLIDGRLGCRTVMEKLVCTLERCGRPGHRGGREVEEELS